MEYRNREDIDSNKRKEEFNKTIDEIKQDKINHSNKIIGQLRDDHDNVQSEG